MATPRNFARRMGRLADSLGRNRRDALRRVAVEIGTRLVLRTPVDEGTARSNWLVGINSPRRDVTGATSPNAAIAAAESKARAADSDDQVWISNNLPYVSGLNRGRSQQAPAGYVEKSVSDGAAVVRNLEFLEG